MKDIPKDFLARAHDPRIVRKILADEIAGLLYDALRSIRGSQITSENIVKIKHRLELDILKYARNRFNWSARELPLQIQLDMFNGTVAVDLTGPLAVDVCVAIEEFTAFGQTMPLPDFLLDNDEDEDEEAESAATSEWSYGR